MRLLLLGALGVTVGGLLGAGLGALLAYLLVASGVLA